MTINKPNCFFQPFIDCGCSSIGSNSTACTSSGVCTCKSNLMDDKCSSCKVGFYDYPDCYGKIQDIVW